jgi:DedD protein
MQEKNELNDIILNKGGVPNNNKKIVLAVATLGVILIIVVMLMNSLTSSGTDNLPQAVLPPEPKAQELNTQTEEPLFEEIEVVQEDTTNNDNLDKIAQKLKQESQEQRVQSEVEIIEPEIIKEAPKKVTQKTPTPKKVEKTETAKISSETSNRYIQVGSFSKYEPNKKFLQSITNKGYKYRYHKVVRNSKTLNKVLVGPFDSESEAREALKSIRASIEAGAFITKI